MPLTLIRAFGDLSAPGVGRIVVRSIALALLGLVATVAASAWLLTQVSLVSLGWLDTAIDVLGGVGVAIAAWFLFPAVLVAVSGLFLEGVADAVERRHYPHLPPPRDVGLAESLGGALRLFALTALLNLLLLPAWFVPGLNVVVFIVLNGYLLSREYVELVASRRMAPARVKSLRRDHRLRLFGAGATIVFLLAIPLVNLLAPVIATAFMVHVVQGLPERSA